MTMRVCVVPGWPTLTTTGSRCPTHQREKEQARGTSTQRGYGYAHQQIRARDKRIVDAGNAHCWRCGAWLNPTQPWHEGHDDNDRSLYRGPECVPCNTSTASRRPT